MTLENANLDKMWVDFKESSEWDSFGFHELDDFCERNYGIVQKDTHKILSMWETLGIVEEIKLSSGRYLYLLI